MSKLEGIHTSFLTPRHYILPDFVASYHHPESSCHLPAARTGDEMEKHISTFQEQEETTKEGRCVLLTGTDSSLKNVGLGSWKTIYTFFLWMARQKSKLLLHPEYTVVPSIHDCNWSTL